MLADLHMHTSFSDGAQSPAEVVKAAVRKGLDLISVCDHDTIEAYDSLRPLCQMAGLRLIQGVELDVYWRGKTLHVLGYAFDPQNPAMAKLMQSTRLELMEVSVQMVKKMLPDYPALNMEDYEQFTYPPGEGGWKGLHYLRARGLTKELMDGFSFHQKYGGYIPDYCDIGKACAIVREAGGVPVLAHPGCWWPNMPADFEDILDDLRSLGIGGIECHYPGHTKDLTQFCVDYCRIHDLRITCGGDGHGGFNNYPGGVVHDIGILQVDMNELDLKGII